jgi:protein gp37
VGEVSKIEWTDATFNPWVGCTKISAACDHCYAEGWAKRSGQVEWGGERRRTTAANWRKPIKWNAKAAAEGRRIRVFCASLADVFDNQVPAEWRDDLWALIRATPNLDWQLLTKRPQNIVKMLPADWGAGYANVWLGTTVENQTEADRRIPHLLTTPARLRFLSCEPLLGPLELRCIEGYKVGRGWDIADALTGEGLTFDKDGEVDKTVTTPSIDWVIVGGESGGDARPMNPVWVRDLHEHCTSAGVPMLFKQWGEWFPYGGIDADGHQNSRTRGERLGLWHTWPDGEGFSVRIGKKQAGRYLDGVLHDGMPHRKGIGQ